MHSRIQLARLDSAPRVADPARSKLSHDVAFRLSSSRMRPLKPPKMPCCMGLPEVMKRQERRFWTLQASIEVSSVQCMPGRPRPATTASSFRATRLPEIDVSLCARTIDFIREQTSN